MISLYKIIILLYTQYSSDSSSSSSYNMKFKVSLIVPIQFIKNPSKFSYPQNEITKIMKIFTENKYPELLTLDDDSCPYYVLHDKLIKLLPENFDDSIIEIELDDLSLSSIFPNTVNIEELKQLNQAVNYSSNFHWNTHHFTIVFRLRDDRFFDDDLDDDDDDDGGDGGDGAGNGHNQLNLSILYDYQTTIIDHKQDENPYFFNHMNEDHITKKAYLVVTSFEDFKLSSNIRNSLIK